MTKFLALNISVSEDGFMAGPNQSEDNPLGENGKLLHSWAIATESMQRWFGGSGGTTGTDNDFIERGFTNFGASIMGRNMFGPVRGEWPDNSWKGWWGPNPPFEYPVFILTHYPRNSEDMGNGTIFYFVTGGITEAYELAIKAAKGKDVRVGGGAQTLQQSMELGLLDEIHTVEVPIKLNGGEALFANKGSQLKHYRKADPIVSDSVIHQTYIRI